MIPIWKMSFGQYDGWSPDDLPPLLRKHYKLLRPEGIIDGNPSHHLWGIGIPSKEVLDAITEYFNQYLHLRMPFGLKSYVWPSEEPGPVRSHPDRAIDHFYCSL